MRVFLLLISIIASSITVNASHLLGGGITWTCLPNGSFIFSMVVYRDCSGIQFQFQNETVNVLGSPLPTNGISSIVLKPDSNRWINSNFGETSPSCTGSYGQPLSCANADNGTVQAYYYTSDPVTLTGTPPSSGWDFFWEAPCCRPGQITNVNTGGTGNLLLKATMFPSANSSLATGCFDSSPIFVDIPQVILCRSSPQKIKHLAEDEDGDSLSFEWGQPINSPISSPVSVPYNMGYSQTNPMPDQTFDSLNIPATLNSKTGDLSFAVYSGVGVEKFIQHVEVTAWKNGIKTGTVSREIVFSITDCPTLPSGDTNKVPEFVSTFTQDTQGIYRDTVVAGTFIDEVIFLSDNDSTGVAGNIQLITMVPFGQSFSNNFALGGGCGLGSSCAYLDFPPFLNTAATPAEFQFIGQTIISTRFKWQTDCSNLKDSTELKTHYFTFKYYDDHCPVPQMAYQTLAITVLPSTQPCSLLTSIENEVVFRNRVELFPNPTSGRFSIQFTNQLEEVELTIRDISGKLVHQKQYANQNIELDINGRSGIYFVQITNALGEQVNLKVIKQ